MKSLKVSVFMGLLFVVLLGACKDNDLENYENELLGNDEGELNEEVSKPLSSEEVDLLLRHVLVDDNNRLREMVESVAEKIGVTIELNPMDVETQNLYYDRLVADASRGKLPHIIELLPFTQPFVYEETENLLDLTDFLEEKGMIEQFISLDHYTVDGRVYGLPIQGYTNQLFYNKELLESLGGVPETWEEFIDRLVEANQAGYSPIVFDEKGMDALLLFEGILQRTVSIDKAHDMLNESSKWTDDEFIHAFELMEEFSQIDIPRIKTELPGDPIELVETFFTEDIVFLYTGDFLPTFQSEEEFAHTKGNIGVIPMPPVTGGQGDQQYIHGSFKGGFVFNADVTEKEEQMIYQFIETLWSDEYMFNYNVEFGYAPPIHMELDTNDLFGKIIQLNNQATGVYHDFIHWDITSDYEDLIFNVLFQLMDGELSAHEAAEILQEQHELEVDEGNI